MRALGRNLAVTVDGVPVLEATVTRTTGTTTALTATGGTAHFQEVRARTPQNWFTDPHRPGHHYTQLASHTSDPNGLVHHEGSTTSSTRTPASGRTPSPPTSCTGATYPSRCPSPTTATPGPGPAWRTPTTPAGSSAAAAD